MVIHPHIHQQLAAARQADLRGDAERYRPVRPLQTRRTAPKTGPRATDGAPRLALLLRLRPAAHGWR